MAFISITEAARLTGKSLPTIYRHINTGKLSQLHDKTIDTAELIRVYGQLRINDSQQELSNDSQNELLRVKLELLEIQLQREKETVEDLRERLTQSEAERRQLTQMLTHQPPQPEATKPESLLYQKLFGKR